MMNDEGCRLSSFVIRHSCFVILYPASRVMRSAGAAAGCRSGR